MIFCSVGCGLTSNINICLIVDVSESVQLEEDVVEVDGGEEIHEDDNDNENDVEVLPENEDVPEVQ